ncbi:MAG: polyphenol oxidase family protein [Bdellovibrionales bacterium]|nr:polyphenol oxidase family protein [Bdellovibrionales bacterium]
MAAESFLTSSLMSRIPGVIHGFGTRAKPAPEVLAAHWDDRPTWKQVHGVRSVEITGPKQAAGDTDGLFTRKKNIPIAAISADCVPILLAKADASVVASVHAGWRGTQACAVQALWLSILDSSAELGIEEKTKNWVAAIGPSIGPCCYETSPEIAQDFLGEYGTRGVPKHRHLNLAEINKIQLEQLGFRAIEIIPYCTRCAKLEGDSDFSFHSYRREKKNGIWQYSAIQLA